MAFQVLFDPFEVLGVGRDASSATIKSKYQELARRYHPNRHQGSEESQAALAKHFQPVHQAWTYLKVPEKRRRYVELLQLAEDQDALLVKMADLLNQTVQQSEQNQQSDREPALVDGYVSSDADEDELPRVGKLQRRTTLDHVMNGTQHLGDIPEESSGAARWSALHKRVKSHHSNFNAPSLSTNESAGSDRDYFSLRRKKLEKLKRKEMASFIVYREAMLNKFQAELEAEKQKELFERARWKREYFERVPRETSERFRSFQQFMGAMRAFGQQSTGRRRNHSTASYSGQILSTGDAFESGEYLAPSNVTSPSQTRSLHRRGWSSDVSGDQESSDENSSGALTPRQGSPFLWHRRHLRHTSLEAFRLATSSRIDGCTETLPSQQRPFTLVVRQPTGLGDDLEMNDSSPASPSATSRSPSPRPSEGGMNKFVMISSSPFTDILGLTPVYSSTQTSDTIKEQASTNGISTPASISPMDASSFLIKTVRQAELHRIPFDSVHLLNQSEKSRLLGIAPDTELDPEELMKRLSRLDPLVASNFEVKPDIMESFNFRLVYNHREVTKAQHQSFIALSYRRRIHVENKHGYYTLPLEKEMFQAVWEERQSESEGLWIDQICIDQLSDTEKTISMSAMDLLYRSARLVVVVLDDIELDAHEGEILENHMKEYESMTHVASNKRFRRKQPPYLDTHDDLYQVLRKVLRSSWYRRAWCRHEMRLARDHVFLVPCRSPGTWTGMSIIRFTGHCLTHLLALATEVPFDEFIELVKPALHAFFRDRSKLPPHERHLHSHHGNFTTVVSEVFAMETGGDPRIPEKQRKADALKDKIAIILNTMECGLALTKRIREPKAMLSKGDCHYMLMLLALAAQDPGALCSVGPPMRLTLSEATTPTASSTWLFEPTNVDAGLNNYRTLKRLPADAVIHTQTELEEHFVQLDLKFLQPGRLMHDLEDLDSLDLAKRITAFCDLRKLGRNRKRYLVGDAAAKRHFGSMHDVYIQTLACVLECGPEWMEEVCHRYGVARSQQSLQGAYELLIAFKNTIGRWPKEAWSEEAVGFVMDFVNFLIIRGMPQRQILHHEEWRPIWVRTPTGGKLLTFVPPGNPRAAVPVALLDPDYLHLARMWILQPRESFYDGKARTDWTLLGKSVLFSDDLAIQELQSTNGTWLEQQKVFGREDPEIQSLLRERSLHE